MKATQTITINTKVGDDIEEVATYINGQTELVSASVDGEGKLQIFAGTDKVQGDVTFSGGLAVTSTWDQERRSLLIQSMLQQ